VTSRRVGATEAGTVGLRGAVVPGEPRDRGTKEGPVTSIISRPAAGERTHARHFLRIPHTPISILAGLILWQLVVWVFHPNPLAVVGPIRIGEELGDLMSNAGFWADLSVSMQAFAIGYALAAVVAVPLGLAVGSNRILNLWLTPWINGLYATPIIGFAPLFIIVFGFTLSSKIAVVVSLAIFPILINTVSGAKAVGRDYQELAVVYRANKLETFRRVLFPGSVPFILTGLRLAIGRALIAVVVADLFGASDGIGLRLQRAAEDFDTASIYAITVVLAFLGVVLSGLVQLWENRMYRGRTS
jgi:ABC-type nitrate/sulfonate/bicarbonate transport system permease component